MQYDKERLLLNEFPKSIESGVFCGLVRFAFFDYVIHLARIDPSIQGANCLGDVVHFRVFLVGNGRENLTIPDHEDGEVVVGNIFSQQGYRWSAESGVHDTEHVGEHLWGRKNTHWGAQQKNKSFETYQFPPIT